MSVNCSSCLVRVPYPPVGSDMPLACCVTVFFKAVCSVMVSERLCVLFHASHVSYCVSIKHLTSWQPLTAWRGEGGILLRASVRWRHSRESRQNLCMCVTCTCSCHSCHHKPVNVWRSCLRAFTCTTFKPLYGACGKLCEPVCVYKMWRQKLDAVCSLLLLVLLNERTCCVKYIHFVKL